MLYRKIWPDLSRQHRSTTCRWKDGYMIEIIETIEIIDIRDKQERGGGRESGRCTSVSYYQKRQDINSCYLIYIRLFTCYFACFYVNNPNMFNTNFLHISIATATSMTSIQLYSFIQYQYLCHYGLIPFYHSNSSIPNTSQQQDANVTRHSNRLCIQSLCYQS